jgi:hypothetical protein
VSGLRFPRPGDIRTPGISQATRAGKQGVREMMRLRIWLVSYGAIAALILAAVAGKKW